MDRRGFIGSILALGVAPAIVRADSLMRIVPRDLVIAYDLKPRDCPFDPCEEWEWAPYVTSKTTYTRVGNIITFSCELNPPIRSGY